MHCPSPWCGHTNIWWRVQIMKHFVMPFFFNFLSIPLSESGSLVTIAWPFWCLRYRRHLPDTEIQHNCSVSHNYFSKKGKVTADRLLERERERAGENSKHWEKQEVLFSPVAAVLRLHSGDDLTEGKVHERTLCLCAWLRVYLCMLWLYTVQGCSPLAVFQSDGASHWVWEEHSLCNVILRDDWCGLRGGSSIMASYFPWCKLFLPVEWC
jgi:hypothetical protein